MEKENLASVGGKLKAERIGATLGSGALRDRLKDLPGWEVTSDGKALARTYEFPTFRAAVAFVHFVAEVAEAQGHHPEIEIQRKRVTLKLATREASGVTEQDVELARRIAG